MKQLAINFQEAYPDLAPKEFTTSCKITEPENAGTKKFQQIELTDFSGYYFPHELAGKASSFPRIARHKGVLLLDCDGVTIFEKNGQKYILYTELKSSFILEEIVKAKDQLVGTHVKIKGVLSTLQGYDINEYKPIGLIVSFAPTQEQLTTISKNYDKRASFAISLSNMRKYHMPSEKCNQFYVPLAVGDFEIYYVGVPNRQTNYSISINEILK